MHQKLKLFLCLLIGIQFKAFCQTIRLSDQAVISLITAEPGQEDVSSGYGHNAIRIFDPANQIDIASDYGVFDFDDPDFLFNYVKGYLNYQMLQREFPRFAYSYQYYNRSIHEQVLNLTAEEKQAMFEYLIKNALPENKFYLYDYFYNNCSTKIWDVFEDILGDKLIFNPDFVNETHSFRTVVDSLLVYQPWLDLGIDLCLGLPMDKTLTPKEYMFLPGYLNRSVEAAKIIRNNREESLVRSSHVLFQSTPNEHKLGFFTPNMVFWLIFAVIAAITIYGYNIQKAFHALDIIWFTGLGLVGILLFFLWFFTDHKAADNNLNLLWAIPFHLPAGWLLIRKNIPNWLVVYFQLTAILMFVLLITWPVNPQGYNSAFFPIIAATMIRSFFIYRFYKKKVTIKTS